MTETAVFGGGCFWCTEAVFRRLIGVSTVTSGYAGGQTDNPDYESVSTGTTGHAEVIQIEFDPNIISYQTLLEVFFTVHDATQKDRQGADVGTQYRSIILTTSQEQLEQAEKKVKEQGSKITTQVAPLEKFYTAEQYHHAYYDRNPTQPYCLLTIVPKLDKVQEKFRKYIKTTGKSTNS